MRVLDEQTVGLPVYDQPLASATPGPQSLAATAAPVGPDIGEYRIRETRADSGIESVTVADRVDGEPRGRYRFDVIDFDQRICRYTGSDDPPWAVYCAVTRFGYHCQTAPESPRRYTFDLLSAAAIELINQIGRVDKPYLAGSIGRVAHALHEYVHLIALEAQLGAESVASLASEPSGGETATEQLRALLVATEVADPFFPRALGHPAAATLLDRSERPTTSAADDQVSEPTEAEVEVEVEAETDADTATEPAQVVAADVVGTLGRGDRTDELYVHRITGDAIDRFSFHVTDVDAATCVAQTNVVGDLPPYGVVAYVTDDLGYTVTNLPSFTPPELSQTERLLEVDHVTRKAVSQVPPESTIIQQVLDRYLRELTLALCVAAAYEVAPAAYDEAIASVFDQLGVPLQTATVSQIGFEQLDQLTSAAFAPLDASKTDAIKARSRDLLASARLEDRRPTDTDEIEASDIGLLGQLVDLDRSIHDDRLG